MKRANALVAPTKNAPKSGIKLISSKSGYDFKKCETALNIGLFFDGTNNNLERDRPKHGDTNVVRLYAIYSKDSRTGYSPVYIPGVGTRFPEIGENTDSKLGLGCAIGSEGRVIYALLSVFNALHFQVLQSNMFDEKSVLALCRNGLNVTDNIDRENLGRFGVHSGLLQVNVGTQSIRREFLTQQASYLQAKLKDGKPRVVECFVDVFGFSRGAAQARVFCNWLDELLVQGRLAGVPVRFRFLGIIDTVASAGFFSGLAAAVSSSTGGHGAWASGEAMRIPASVPNCVHMVAMHELRRNFPLDEIGIDGKLPAGSVQFAYPGAHSDVGGGYMPGELGLAVRDDSRKLSQIPLNHMLECALAAGVPLNKAPVVSGRYDPFAIHPDVTKAYDEFLAQTTLAPRPIHEWLQMYLNWRWQVRDRFPTMTQVAHANPADRAVLITWNNRLINDAAAMIRSGSMGVGKRTFAVVKDVFFSGARQDLLTTSTLDPEARDVLALAQRAGPTPPAYAALFDGYVHDSLAGFNLPKSELPGYWRYRRVFLGNDEHVLASNQGTEMARDIA